MDSLSKTNTRVFPVTVDLSIKKPDGAIQNGGTITVQNETERVNQNNTYEQQAKAILDALFPKHIQNDTISYSGKVDPYYGGWFEIFNQWNLSGKSDFPVKILGTYSITSKGGRQTNIEDTAANETERIQKSNAILTQIQNIILTEYNKVPPPTFRQNQVIDSGFISYRNGYGYNIITTMNITGTSDYPAKVYVKYSTPLLSSNTTLAANAHNATELESIKIERANQAKAEIDRIIDNDKYPPFFVETITSATSYGGGSYRSTFTYSGNPGQDYPGYVDTIITYRNGSRDTLNIEAGNANQKSTYAGNLESQARLQIDNYNPTYPANTIMSDGPYKYGTKGSEYTIKVKYNRVGTNANYPALVWIEYKSRSTGAILDTRNTYGSLIANSSVEKDQMKDALLSFVTGQMVALGGPIDSQSAYLRTRIENLLPVGKAYAATVPGSSISVGNSVTKSSYSVLDNYNSRFQFLGNNGVLNQFLQKQPGKPSIVGTNEAAIKKIINDRITSAMDKYGTNGTIYLGDIPDSVMPVMTAIFTDVINKRSADEIYTKYKQQLVELGVTTETMGNIYGNILIVASEGVTGTQQVYPENYFFGAKALFGLGKIGITMLINQATGKILAQSIVGEGGVEFLKYEARVNAGNVAFTDAVGNVIKLEQGLVGKWGFNYIFKTPKNIADQTRIEQVIEGLLNKPVLYKILGKGSIDSFGDFEKIIAYTLKNANRVLVPGNKAEYTLDFGGKFFRVVTDSTDGRIINILPR